VRRANTTGDGKHFLDAALLYRLPIFLLCPSLLLTTGSDYRIVGRADVRSGATSKDRHFFVWTTPVFENRKLPVVPLYGRKYKRVESQAVWAARILESYISSDRRL
jgi:hypothetical protein